MGLCKVADISENIVQVPEVATRLLRRMGSSFYNHKRREEEAQKASKAVDYLVRKGVLKND